MNHVYISVDSPPLDGPPLAALPNAPPHSVDFKVYVKDFTSRYTEYHAAIPLTVAVFRIRIHVFLGLLDPDPDPLVRGIDPDPSIIKQK
jgi:hypothetical protein